MEFARVLLPGQERSKHTVNGWPLWFTRQVGRGKVIFTTLAPRGWYQRKKGQAVPTDALTDVATEVQPPRQDAAFHLDDLRPLLTEGVGYSVVGVDRGPSLRRLLAGGAAGRPRPAAVAPAGAAGLGGSDRGVGAAGGVSSASGSVAPVGAAHRGGGPDRGAVSGKDEAAVHGLMAVYRPESGPVEGAPTAAASRRPRPS